MSQPNLNEQGYDLDVLRNRSLLPNITKKQTSNSKNRKDNDDKSNNDFMSDDYLDDFEIQPFNYYNSVDNGNRLVSKLNGK